MAEPRKPELGQAVEEQKEVAPVETKPSGKTLQELERLQFDGLERQANS